VLDVVGLSRASTATFLFWQLIFFFSGACCWHQASNVGRVNSGIGLSGMGCKDGVGNLDWIATAFWEDGERGMCWDELGSAGMAVLLRNNKLLSSIALITGGSGLGFTAWPSHVTSVSVEKVGL